MPWAYKPLCSAFKGAEIKDKVCPWRADVVVGSYQAGLESLGRALQNYFQGREAGRNVGFPKYRTKGKCHESIIFQRPRIKSGKRVDLHKKLCSVKTKESMRKLTRLLDRDPNARILRSTVQRGNGGWVISFTVTRDRALKLRQARRPDTVVGVDMGLTSLATLSTGEQIDNFRPLKDALKELRRLQKGLDRQRRASNPGNYLRDGRVKPGRKAWTVSQRMRDRQARVNRLHERVANLRREQAHLFTTGLTREYGIIGGETLAVANLMKNKKLARHISDVGWGMIQTQLKYKTAWTEGSVYHQADRYYPSSKTCSECGAVRTKLRLSERSYNCENEACSLVLDRDWNAARNLAGQALGQARKEGRQEMFVARARRFTLIARGEQGKSEPGRSAPLVETRRPDVRSSCS